MSNSPTGLREWIIQRVSALYMAAYIIFLFIYLLVHPHLDYQDWSSFFRCPWVQVLSLIFVVGMVWHAWIGIWTVITDYIKIPCIRMIVQLAVIFALFVYLFWSIAIIWAI